MQRFVSIVGLGAALCLCGRDRVAVSAEPQLVLARHADVRLYSERGVESPIPVGLALDVIRTKGDRLWVGRGWLNRSDAVALSDAVPHFTQEIADRPTPFLYVSRARAYLQSGDTAAALHDCQSALELDPTSAAAHCQHGRALHEQRRFEDAVAAFGCALEVEPESALAHYYRAQSRLSMGDVPSAAADLNRAIEYDDQLTPAFFVRGCLRSQQEDDRAAIDDFSTVIRLNPCHFPALNNRANALARLERWTAAVADYTAALQLSKRSDTLTNRAFAHLKLGQIDEALADCNEAIRLQPAWEAAYRIRAALLEELGRMSEAEADAEHAEKLAAQRPV